MTIKDYSSNSIKSKNASEKTPEKVIKKVADAKLVDKKSKIAGLVETDVKTAGNSLVNEVIFPGIIRFVSDTLHAAVDSFLFPGQEPKKPKTWVSYNNYSNKGQTHRTVYQDNRESHNKIDLNSVELDSRQEAETVIDTMMDLCQQYDDICSVSDYLEMVGLTGEYTDNDYGWSTTDLKSAYVTRGRNGKYSIKVPKPHPIN